MGEDTEANVICHSSCSSFRQSLAIPWESVVAIQGAPRLRVFVWWVHLGERAWSQHVQFLVLQYMAQWHCTIVG